MNLARQLSNHTFEIDGLDFPVLAATPLEFFGLVQKKYDEWHYKSRPYQSFHWTIEPFLIFRIDQFDDGISLELEQVQVVGLGSMTDSVKVRGGICLCPALVGTRVKRWLELGVRRGSRPWRVLPSSFLDKAVATSLHLVAERLDRALHRRLTLLSITLQAS